MNQSLFVARLQNQHQQKIQQSQKLQQQQHLLQLHQQATSLQSHQQPQKLLSSTSQLPKIPHNHIDNDNITQDLDTTKLTSKHLQHCLFKLDGQISSVEQSILKLQQKCQELMKGKCVGVGSSVESDDGVLEVSMESRTQTMARSIYAQNKFKASLSRSSLLKLGKPPDQALYTQPSDTKVYHDNIEKFTSFKKHLVAHLTKKQRAEKIRVKYLNERYNQLYNQWVEKVDKTENSSCKKEKDLKYKEYFEKVFPDLKKQKENKDKFQRFSAQSNRPPGYARSEANLEEIVNELHEEEVKASKMSSLSVTVPMLLDRKARERKFVDETRLVRNLDFPHKLWVSSETEIFAEKFQQFPKKFGVIASSLENKTVQDSVLFYYLTKKAANYKQIARRYQANKKKDKKFRTNQNNVQLDKTTLTSSENSSEISFIPLLSIPPTTIHPSAILSSSSHPSIHPSFIIPSQSSTNISTLSTFYTSKTLLPSSSSLPTSSSSPPSSSPTSLLSSSSPPSSSSPSSSSPPALSSSPPLSSSLPSLSSLMSSLSVLLTSTLPFSSLSSSSLSASYSSFSAQSTPIVSTIIISSPTSSASSLLISVSSSSTSTSLPKTSNDTQTVLSSPSSQLLSSTSSSFQSSVSSSLPIVSRDNDNSTFYATNTTTITTTSVITSVITTINTSTNDDIKNANYKDITYNKSTISALAPCTLKSPLLNHQVITHSINQHPSSIIISTINSHQMNRVYDHVSTSSSVSCVSGLKSTLNNKITYTTNTSNMFSVSSTLLSSSLPYPLSLSTSLSLSLPFTSSSPNNMSSTHNGLSNTLRSNSIPNHQPNMPPSPPFPSASSAPAHSFDASLHPFNNPPTHPSTQQMYSIPNLNNNTNSSSNTISLPHLTPSKPTIHPATHTNYLLEDISDKEDSDSVVTLSADEGPSLLDKDADKEPGAKRIKLSDGQKHHSSGKHHNSTKNQPSVVTTATGDDEEVMTLEMKLASWSSSHQPSSTHNRLMAAGVNSQPELSSNKESLVNYHDKYKNPNFIPVSNNKNNKSSNNITPFLTSKSSPARIKDLIHATIEKNLQSKNNNDNVKGVKGSKGDRIDPNGIGRSSQQQQWKSDVSNYIPLQQQFIQQQLLQQHKLIQQQNNNKNNNLLLSKSSTVDDLIKHHLQNSPTHLANYHQTPQLSPHKSPPDSLYRSTQSNNMIPKVTTNDYGADHFNSDHSRLYELAVAATELGRLDEKKSPLKEIARDMSREVFRPESDHMCHRSTSLQVPFLTTHHSSSHPSNNLNHISSHLLQSPPTQARGSITKGTSGKYEQQHKSATASFNNNNNTPLNLAFHDFHPSTNVLKNDFLIAQQMIKPPQTYLSNNNNGLSPKTNHKNTHSPTNNHSIPSVNDLCSQDDLKRRASVGDAENNPQNSNNLSRSSQRHSLTGLQDETFPGPKTMFLEEVNLHRTTEQLQKHLSKLAGSSQQMTAANLIEAIIYLQINKLDKSDASSPEISQRIFTPDHASSTNSVNKKTDLKQFTCIETADQTDKVQEVDTKQPQASIEHIKGYQHNSHNTLLTSKFNKPSEERVDADDDESRGKRKHNSGCKDMKTRMIDEWLASSLQTYPHHHESHNKASPAKKSRLSSPQLSPASQHPRLTHKQLQRHQLLLNQPSEKIVTASDRIEAIIAADIGSEDPGLLQNKEVQTAMKEYLKMSSSFDSHTSPILPLFNPPKSYHNNTPSNTNQHMDDNNSSYNHYSNPSSSNLYHNNANNNITNTHPNSNNFSHSFPSNNNHPYNSPYANNDSSANNNSHRNLSRPLITTSTPSKAIKFNTHQSNLLPSSINPQTINHFLYPESNAKVDVNSKVENKKTNVKSTLVLSSDNNNENYKTETVDASFKSDSKHHHDSKSHLQHKQQHNLQHYNQQHITQHPTTTMTSATNNRLQSKNSNVKKENIRNINNNDMNINNNTVPQDNFKFIGGRLTNEALSYKEMVEKSINTNLQQQHQQMLQLHQQQQQLQKMQYKTPDQSATQQQVHQQKSLQNNQSSKFLQQFPTQLPQQLSNYSSKQLSQQLPQQQSLQLSQPNLQQLPQQQSPKQLPQQLQLPPQQQQSPKQLPQQLQLPPQQQQLQKQQIPPHLLKEQYLSNTPSLKSDVDDLTTTTFSTSVMSTSAKTTPTISSSQVSTTTTQNTSPTTHFNWKTKMLRQHQREKNVSTSSSPTTSQQNTSTTTTSYFTTTTTTSHFLPSSTFITTMTTSQTLYTNTTLFVTTTSFTQPTTTSFQNHITVTDKVSSNTSLSSSFIPPQVSTTPSLPQFVSHPPMQTSTHFHTTPLHCTSINHPLSPHKLSPTHFWNAHSPDSSSNSSHGLRIDIPNDNDEDDNDVSKTIVADGEGDDGKHELDLIGARNCTKTCHVDNVHLTIDNKTHTDKPVSQDSDGPICSFDHQKTQLPKLSRTGASGCNSSLACVVSSRVCTNGSGSSSDCLEVGSRYTSVAGTMTLVGKDSRKGEVVVSDNATSNALTSSYVTLLNNNNNNRDGGENNSSTLNTSTTEIKQNIITSYSNSNSFNNTDTNHTQNTLNPVRTCLSSTACENNANDYVSKATDTNSYSAYKTT